MARGVIPSSLQVTLDLKNLLTRFFLETSGTKAPLQVGRAA